MRLLLIVALVVCFIGCGKKAEPQSQSDFQSPAPTVEEPVMTDPVMEEPQRAPEPVAAVSKHTVRIGESLWFIAGYDDVYGNPFKWTRIYEANKDQISDPDLIYPDQVFSIPR